MGFFLYKLTAHLLLPPGLFVLLSLASGTITILILRRREIRSPGGRHLLRVLMILCFSNALLIYLGSIVPVAALLNAPLEGRYRSSTPDAGNAGDCVVVLGGGIDAVRRGDGELRYYPSRSSTIRLSEAAALYFERPDRDLTIVLSGGFQSKKDRAESDVYAEFLRRLGIPDERLLRETQSRNTLENALYVQPIVQEQGWRRPLLVTTANHMRRAMWTFGQFGIEAIPVATDFTGTPARFAAVDLFPNPQATQRVKSALWEYIGLLWYRLRFLARD